METECPPVTVKGDWDPSQSKTVKNKLQLYFQSRKKSGGGDCRVEVEDGAPRAAVYFKRQDVRDNVLAKENHEITLGNQSVRLRLSSAAVSKTPKTEADFSIRPYGRSWSSLSHLY
uniref:PAR14-like first RRM domain-containing protein n=1 Tax=Mastacembelus armatus TaxID=205130 RepID=A0A7N8Y4G0_9TELE